MGRKVNMKLSDATQNNKPFFGPASLPTTDLRNSKKHLSDLRAALEKQLQARERRRIEA